MNVQEVINVARQLPPEEKRQVLAALQNDLNTETTMATSETTEVRRRRLEWLKTHREEYAGQYVAMDGDRLVGHAPRISEARAQAVAQGVENPFLMRVESAETIVAAGW